MKITIAAVLGIFAVAGIVSWIYPEASQVVLISAAVLLLCLAIWELSKPSKVKKK